MEVTPLSVHRNYLWIQPVCPTIISLYWSPFYFIHIYSLGYILFDILLLKSAGTSWLQWGLGYHFQPANLFIVLWGYCLSCCSSNNFLVFPCLWNSLQIYIKSILFRGNCQNYFRYFPLYSLLFCCFSIYIYILLLRGMLLLLWCEVCQNSASDYSQLSLSKCVSLFFLLMGQV